MAREGDTEDTLTGKLAELLRAEDKALAAATARRVRAPESRSP